MGERWTGDAFGEEVRRWASGQLAAAGARLTGEWWQPHRRPWSTALRLGTTQGPVWVKVNGSGTRHEPGLLQLLQDLAPGLGPEVLAVDTRRGWSLTRDAGSTLRELAAAAEQWGTWEQLLPRYAEAQLALARHGAACRAAGVREVSPVTLPQQARALVDELYPGQPGGLAPDQADRLERLLPRFDDWCAELAGSGLPTTLQHDDLHAGNVCVAGPATRIIDWGDACWGCAPATLLTTLRSLAHHAGLPADAVPVRRVRDAYLEPFSSYGGRAELLRWVDLASRTGCVGRALAWRAGLADSPVEASAEYDHPVRGWVLELLDALETQEADREQPRSDEPAEEGRQARGGAAT